jgi:hypothetical protein
MNTTIFKKITETIKMNVVQVLHPTLVVNIKTIALPMVLTIALLLPIGISMPVMAQLPSQCSTALIGTILEPSGQCWNIGYQDGLANIGTSCPSGMNGSFCGGWNTAQEHSNSNGAGQQQPSTGVGNNRAQLPVCSITGFCS